MRLASVFVIISLFITSFVVAQPSLPAIISGDVYTQAKQNAMAFSANPSILASQSSYSIALLGEKLFLLPGLDHYRFAASFPFLMLKTGIYIDHFGNGDYSHNLLGLSFARTLGEKVEGGLQFRYYSEKISGYEGNSAIGARAGVRFKLTSQLTAAASVTNPLGTRWRNRDREEIPSIYVLGFGFDASPHCFISLESVKETGEPVQVNASIKYIFHPRLFARAGIQSANASYCFGIGFLTRQMQVDIIVNAHPVLGITPGIMVCFDNKKKEK